MKFFDKTLGRRASLLVITTIFFGACGVPSASMVVQIPESELPVELNQQATTSTTSSTLVPESAKDTTLSIPEVVSEQVELYYISANRVVATNISVASPATTSQVLAALVAGPPGGDNGFGLRSALPKNLSATVAISKGIATIDTTAQFLSDLSPIDQRLAIAQLVLTFTRRPGVGQIVFTVDGVEVAVPRGRGDLSKPGSPVSFDDYSSLLIATTG